MRLRYYYNVNLLLRLSSRLLIVVLYCRRMFPLLGLTLTGLQPDSVYDVMVDLVPVNRFRHRYVYHRSLWTLNAAGFDDVLETPPRCSQHPSSLTQLRQTTVTFDKLKLTNNPQCCNEHVRPVIESMHHIVSLRISVLVKKDIKLTYH